MLANLKPWAGPNMLAGFNFNPLPGPNMLAGLAARKLLADHLLRGSAPIRAEAEAMSGMSGILSLDLPVYLDAVPKQADDQLRQVDPPCPAMQRAAVPPDRACFFLDLCLGKADREIMRGDLEEEFTTSILPRYGARRAQFWFWGKRWGLSPAGTLSAAGCSSLGWYVLPNGSCARSAVDPGIVDTSGLSVFSPRGSVRRHAGKAARLSQ